MPVHVRITNPRENRASSNNVSHHPSNPRDRVETLLAAVCVTIIVALWALVVFAAVILLRAQA